MALSPVISEKWDRLLYNWLLWRDPDLFRPRKSEDDAATNLGVAADGASISSAYKGELYRRSGLREASIPVLLGDAMDVDSLMEILRYSKQTRHLFDALKVWTEGKGTRGMQAASLSCGVRTLYDRVDAGKALLEVVSRQRRRRSATVKSKSTHISAE